MTLTEFLGKIEVAPHHTGYKSCGGEFPESHSKVKDILFGAVCVILSVAFISVFFI